MTILKSMWADCLKDKKSILLKEGTYLSLNDASTLYFLEEGVVDLYIFPSGNIQDKQKASYINTLEEGEVLFGMNAGSDTQNLVVRAHSSVSLKKCSLDEWKDLNKESSDHNALKEMLENWISTLEDSLGKKEEHHLSKKVEPSQKIHLDQDQVMALAFDIEVKRKDQIVWIFVDKGSVIINDDPNIKLFSQSGNFPMLNTDQIKASENTELFIKTTEQILDEGIASQFLDLFYKNFLISSKREKEAENQADSLQLLSEISQESRVVSNSCYILSKVLSHAREIPLVFSDDDLITACQYVAVKLGGFVNAGRFSRNIVTIDDKIREIAQRSSFSYRQVKLAPEIFTHDFDPLIVFDGKTQAPQVLFTSGRKKYQLFNPKTGSTEVFHADDLGTLSSQGYVLYKDFPKSNKKLDLLKFVFEKQWLDISLVIIMGIAIAIISLYIPLAMGYIFDSAVPDHNIKFLAHIVGGLIAVNVGVTCFSLTRAYAILRLEGKTANKLQAALWTRLLELKLPFFRGYSVGDLAQRVTGVDDIRTALGNQSLSTIIASFFAVFYFIVMLKNNSTLAFIMMVPITLAVIICLITISMTVKPRIYVLNTQATIYGFFVQVLDSIRNIRVFSAENRAFAKWSELFAAKKRQQIKLMAINNWLNVSSSVLMSAGQLIMYFFVITFLAKTQNTPGGSQSSFLNIGEFLSFTTAYGFFSSAIFNTSNALLSLLTQILPLWARAKVILEAEIEQTDSNARFEKIYGEITVDQLSFRYTEKMPLLLKNVSFHIKKGSFIGIIGGSGAGKSTLLRLLLGFEKPYRGVISFDDRLIETFDVTFLRQQIGSVLQHGSILLGSIRENIVCARTYSDEEIMHVLQLCCVDEDVKNLPMKLETMLPPGGSTLSECQRQKLLLARALIQKPTILLIDDALSALDLDIQKQIYGNIADMDMTRILLSNRVSMMQHVEFVYVMDKGEIVETGSYDELLSKKGVFARMLKEQTL